MEDNLEMCLSSARVLAGGLIYGLRHRQDDRDKALAFAIDASCLQHYIFGEYGSVSVAAPVKAMSGDVSGRVAR